MGAIASVGRSIYNSFQTSICENVVCESAVFLVMVRTGGADDDLLLGTGRCPDGTGP